jgi:subtilisin family serine protease
MERWTLAIGSCKSKETFGEMKEKIKSTNGRNSKSFCLVGSGFGNAEFGTSFAAPHVSDLAALLLAQSPGMAPDQVRQKLLARLADGDENTQGKGFVSLE